MSRIGGHRERMAFRPPMRDLPSTGSKASAVRMCDEPACTTVLSRYNNESACWVHARPTFVTRSAARHGA